MSLLDLSERSALVVGAGKGIGRATALRLGAAGAHTVVLDRHADRAESVAREIREAGGRADFVVADATDVDSLEETIDAVWARAPGLDVLVNITGSATWVPLLEMEEADWDRDFRVNLDQHLCVGRAVVKRWEAVERAGVVCLVGSISGRFAASGHAAYGAAKAGLLSLVQTAAQEWWPLGVRVNAVLPGSVRTPRIEETLMDPDRPIPEDLLARMLMPEDVAAAIAFLASDLARRVTGQALLLDSGVTTRFPYSLTE
jgi:NAD(P)-dependent dehydrogenase (short-subunit alcohol dehydrogenase family)